MIEAVTQSTQNTGFVWTWPWILQVSGKVTEVKVTDSGSHLPPACFLSS